VCLGIVFTAYPQQGPGDVRRIYSIKSIVIGLIIANVVIFLFTSITRIPAPRGLVVSLAERGNTILAQTFNRYGLFTTIFGLIPVVIVRFGWVWQVFSYMFLHGGFLHLFFNMYALLLFGRPLEQRWGKSRFFYFYIFTGVGAGVVTFIWHLSGWLIFGNTPSMFIPTIGASGAILGLILAFGLEFPDVRLLLFFIIPVRARYAAFIFGGITIFFMASQRLAGVAHLTHLAGLLFGYIFYVWRIKNRAMGRASGAGIKARILEVKQRKSESMTARERENVLRVAEEVKAKIEKDETLSQEEESFLDKLRRSYNLHSREKCSPDEFNPRASDCLKCESLLACLYRYVLDIQ
jgi:membrane associated rhomboid family serine protease